jgi:flagellar hook assembly protein FlgD
LEYVLQQREQVAISIYDLAGKEIFVIQRGTQNEGIYNYTIDAEKKHLNAGIYILKVVAGSRVITRQLVKVKE